MSAGSGPRSWWRCGGHQPTAWFTDTFLVDEALNELAVARESVEAAAVVLAELGDRFGDAAALVTAARAVIAAADAAVMRLRGAS